MSDTILRVAQEGLLLALVCSAPPVLAALVVGLLVGVLQAATQIQEQTIGLVPKIAAVAVALVVAGPWIGAQLLRFTQAVMALIAQV